MDWVPFVLEDAKHALTRWPGAQDRGMWVAGFYSGAAQALTMGGEPEAFLDGYACGTVARGDAEQNRSRISAVRQAAARARWDREQPKQIVMDANAYAVEDAQAHANASANGHAQAMHKTDIQDKAQQGKNKQKNQPHHVSTAATVSTPLSALPPRATPPKPTAAPGWGAVKSSPNPTPRPEPRQPIQEPPQGARNPLATDPAQAEEERRQRWSQRRQEWLETQGGQVDFTVQPGRLLWRSYCRSVHPSWQERYVDKAHATLSLHNWSQGGRKIESWWQVADAWAKNADHTEHFEAFMDGSMGIDASALSASAKGITEGEGFS